MPTTKRDAMVRALWERVGRTPGRTYSTGITRPPPRSVMGPAVSNPAPRTGFARLAGIGVVVFLANAGLLVLQLLAGRLLAPFVGSSLETWTGIIGGFLAGIAVGNALGGRLADRHPSGRALALLLG